MPEIPSVPILGAKAGFDVQADIYPDHVVLRPPNKLKERVARRVDPKDRREVDPIRRAEQALGLLSNEFGLWMTAETDALENARQAVSASPDAAALASLYRAAHDMRGQAATFGFPLAGEIADGLCTLMERLGDRGPPQAIVDRHVEAIRAIVREDARGRDHPLGTALAKRLSDLRQAISPRIDGE